MCMCACTPWCSVYVWMRTESAFTERFMLIVMNGSCWWGKEEGQTEGETFSETKKKVKKSDLNKLSDFIHLVPDYYFISFSSCVMVFCPPYHSLSWFYWTTWAHLWKSKGQYFLFFWWPVTSGFEVISVDLSSSPLGISDPACSSLTFIHIPLEIHPSVFLHSPPPCPHSPTLLQSDAPTDTSSSYQQLSFWHW